MVCPPFDSVRLGVNMVRLLFYSQKTSRNGDTTSEIQHEPRSGILLCGIYDGCNNSVFFLNRFRSYQAYNFPSVRCGIINKLSTSYRLSILLSAMWILAFLGQEIGAVVYFGIMPVVIVWGLFWINSRWSRVGIIVTFMWIVFLYETNVEGIDFTVAMLLPALLWGAVSSRARWWK